MKLNPASSTPVHSLADSICVKFVKPCTRDRCLHRFAELNQHMERSQLYKHVFLNPDDPRRRYDYLQSLEEWL